MEENVLKDLETFDEFPNKKILVNRNSDYYYIYKEGKKIVAERNIDSISNIEVDGKEKVLVKSSYYNVNDGSLIYQTEFISDINGTNKNFTKHEDGVKVICLNEVLNVKYLEEISLTKERLEKLINNVEIEENILKNFETFEKFPNKKIMVIKNSNYYYISKDDKNYIAQKKIEWKSSIEVDGVQKLLIKSNYYNVIDGSLVCQVKFISEVNKKNKKIIENGNNIKIILLSDVLNINDNGVYYLTKEDIEILMNYKNANSTTYGMKPKKNYF